MKDFINKMRIKYKEYMNLAQKKVKNIKKNSILKNDIIETKKCKKPQKKFIDKDEEELLFPGHIRSYYVSAEF